MRDLFALPPLVQLLSAIRNTRRLPLIGSYTSMFYSLVKIPFRDVIPGFFISSGTYHPVGSRFKQSVPTVSRGFAQDRLATEMKLNVIDRGSGGRGDVGERILLIA